MNEVFTRAQAETSGISQAGAALLDVYMAHGLSFSFCHSGVAAGVHSSRYVKNSPIDKSQSIGAQLRSDAVQ